MEGAINEAYRKSPNWPLIVNLRMDPYEVSPDSASYLIPPLYSVLDRVLPIPDGVLVYGKDNCPIQVNRYSVP